MKSAIGAFAAVTLLLTLPASAGGFTGFTFSVTNSVHTSTTDANGNTKKQDSTTTVIYPTGTTPPANTGQQSAHNSTGPGSSGNVQTITQTQTIVILGHH